MASRFRFQPKPKSNTNPVTIGLLVACCVGYLLCWIPQTEKILTRNFALWLTEPQIWQFLTYPFLDYGVGIELIFFMFAMLWLFNFGSMFERAYSSKSLLIHFFALSIIYGLVGLLAAKLVGANAMFLYSSWLPVSFITVTLCATQPETPSSLNGIPVKMKWFAVLVGVFVILTLGAGNPIFGIILCSPLAIAWFYGQGKLGAFAPGKILIRNNPQSVKTNREFDEFKSKVRDKEQERQEKERLRKLFEGSLDDQDPPQAEK